MARTSRLTLAVALAATASLGAQSQEGFKFKSGVELVNVTASVTDGSGRFVGGLTKDDFVVYEDDRVREVSQFSNERVPVSLGILLDTSGSMTPDKMTAARAAISRFVNQLLSPEDELFFVDFNSRSRLDQDWTTDRRRIMRAVENVDANGGTAMYDAIADALPTAVGGKHQKKALLVITDGNDRDSTMRPNELRQAIRESEVLVYALGVDGTTSDRYQQPPIMQPPIPIPFPIPGSRPRGRFPQILGGGGGGSNGRQRRGAWNAGDDRVNAGALRAITDDTGGRTEIVHGFGDLDDATARIADELSKQYYLGYANTNAKDGRWHSIRVEVKDRRYTVRARRGYIAS